LQSELQDTLDVLSDEYKGAKILSQSTMKSIVAYVEVGEFKIFISILISHLDGNSTLSKKQLTWNKIDILYMKLKIFSARNHDTILELSCDDGVYFLNIGKAKI